MKRKFTTFILVFLGQAILYSCNLSTDGDTITSPTNETNENDAKQLFSKSYIEKFSNSWHVFAKANDIAKREKLKKALTDALDSIETKRKSEIITNIDSRTVQRIKHAAVLLKEFKQMYALSENVKKTLYSYNEAKKNLSVTIKTDPGMDILKRFLVHRPNRKRDEIPSHAKDGTVFDKSIVGSPDDEDAPIVQPQYITKTSKIALKAALDKSGHIALEYASVNPSTSSVHKAEKAFKAASILLAYAQQGEKGPIIIGRLNKEVDEKPLESSALKNKSEISDLQDLHEIHTDSPKTPKIQQSGLSYVTHTTNVTGHTNTAESTENTIESLLQNEDTTTQSKLYAKTLKNKEDEPVNRNKTVTDENKLNVTKSTDDTLADKRTNPYVELLKKIQRTKNETQEAITSDKKDSTGPLQTSTPAQLQTSRTDTVSNKTTEDEKLSNENEQIKNKTTEDEKLSNENEKIKNKTTENEKLSNENEQIKNTTTENDTVARNLTISIFNQKEKENSTITNNTNSDSVKVKESTIDSNEKANKEEQKSKSEIKSLDNIVTLKKQQDTVQRLQDAKAARQKYEIAKHELAEKVKELYDMANEYEKQETSDQILEEKNVIGGTNSDKMLLERNFLNTKRDDSHPGIALASIAHHKVKEISTAEEESNLHKGFTMGAKDKNEHQIDLDELKTEEIKDVKKVYDVGLPASLKLGGLKLEDIGKNTAKKSSKSQEETLKVIAEAIQEDMADINEDEKQKKKLLLSTEKSDGTPLVAAVNQNGQKKGSGTNDKMDEYLTKALAEIMGNDTSSSTPTASSSTTASASKPEENKSNDVEKNRKIVEKAMSNHAKNPDLPLPLVETKGDKVVLNKDDNKTKDTPTEAHKSNDVFAHATDRQSSPTAEKSPTLDVHDPENKALLDKASHMEEQVAAAQDKMYQNDLKDPEPVLPAPLQSEQNNLPLPSPRPMAYRPQQSYHPPGDPYGSIEQNPQIPPHISRDQEDREEEPEEREGGDEEEEEEEERSLPHRRHHHHHHHRRHFLEPEDVEEEEEDDHGDEPDDDEDDDEDEREDDDDDKKSHVGYHNEQAKKRTLLPGVTIQNRIKTKAAIITEPTAIVKKSNTNSNAGNKSGNDMYDEKHIEELEDNMKKSYIPRKPRAYNRF